MVMHLDLLMKFDFMYSRKGHHEPKLQRLKFYLNWFESNDKINFFC